MTIATGLVPTFVGSEPYIAPYGKGIKFTWVETSPQEVHPSGSYGFQFGSVALQYNQTLHPEGFANFVSYANGLLYNKNKLIYIYPFTGQPITPLDPKVYNKLQFARPSGIQSGFIAGNVWVSNYYRWMYANTGLKHDSYGYPNVQLGRRYLTNVYIPTTITDFGTPFIAWENRNITPAGFNATYFGTTDIADKAHYLHPVGRASTLVTGTPLVRDRAQRLNPFGVDTSLLGYMVIDLWKKEIKPASMEQWPIEATRFGPYRTVYNRNRRLLANGFVHSVLPQGSFVINKARPIRPYGEVQTRFGVAFAAARIRYVTPEWYDTTLFSYDTWVRTRKIINLDGWGFRGPNVPLPTRVWSNLQTIQPYSTYPMTEMKKPWVSQGLRSLSPSSILTQPAGDPFVSYGVRHIRPLGIEKGYVGVHQLETHQNIIKLWGHYHGAEGTPTVFNKTPMILAYSAYAFEPGIKPYVGNLRRYMQAYGIPASSMGDTFVSYRTRKIRPPSPDYLRWGNGQVMFDQSQLAPPQQKIVPDSIQGGAGVVPNWEWEHPDAPYSGATIPLGYPTVKLNTIFAPSLGQIDKFGTPLTRSMVVFVDPGPASFAFGTVKLYGGTKRISQSTTALDEQFGNTHVVGSQIIHCGQKWDAGTSTWYDWSFHTSQEPDDPWYLWHAQTAGPVFGSKSTATLQHRRIYPSSYYWDVQGFATYGTPRVSTRPQYIRPAGVNSYKRGLPDVSYAGMKPVYVNSWADSGFGAAVAKVQDYGPKWVRPGGLAAGGMGVGRIELKHRRVYPTGIYQFTSPKGAQYIGPYLRIYLKPGLDHAEFGTLYIDYKHRKVYQADVTDDTEPWQTSTATRLKHQARGYFIEGTDFGVQFGLADVGDRVKRVRPAGWEEFETGFSYVPTSYPGLSKLKAQAFVMRPYTSTMEFGNGTVAHG